MASVVMIEHNATLFSPKIDLYSLQSDTPLNGTPLTAAELLPGWFTATYTGVQTGLHRVVLSSSGPTLVKNSFVYLSNSGNRDIAGPYIPNEIDINSKLDIISTNTRGEGQQFVVANGQTLTDGLILSGSYLSTQIDDGVSLVFTKLSGQMDFELLYNIPVSEHTSYLNIKTNVVSAIRPGSVWVYNYTTAQFDLKISVNSIVLTFFTLNLSTDYRDVNTGAVRVRFTGENMGSGDSFTVDFAEVGYISNFAEVFRRFGPFDTAAPESVKTRFDGLNNYNPAVDQVIVATNNDKGGYGVSSGTVDFVNNPVDAATLADKTGFEIAGSKNRLDDLNDISASTVENRCDDALVNLHLDHLLDNSVSGSLPGNSNSIFGKLLEFAGSILRFKENALTEVPAVGSVDLNADQSGVTIGTANNVTNGVTVSTNNDKTGYNISGGNVDFVNNPVSVNAVLDKTGYKLDGTKETLDDLKDFDPLTQTVIVVTNQDKSGYTIQGSKTTLDQLNDITASTVESRCDDALVNRHLDHLLDVAVNTSIPGNTSSILHRILEFFGGVLRFKAAALSQAPSAGGDASAANQAEILDRMGAFSKTGANTILGFLRAIARNDATLPTDMGGSYDSDEHSLEGLRPWIDFNRTEMINYFGPFSTTTNNTVFGFLRAMMRVDAPLPSDVGGNYDSDEHSLESLRGRLNTLHNYDPASDQVIVGNNLDKTGYRIAGTIDILDDLENISAPEVRIEADDALSNIHLDHLLAVSATSFPGVSSSILGEMLQRVSTWRFVTEALSQAPNTVIGNVDLNPDQSGVTIGTTNNVTNGVTVTTNNDKTGYAIDTNNDKAGYGVIGGSVDFVNNGVDVITNNDKTGYDVGSIDGSTAAASKLKNSALAVEPGAAVSGTLSQTEMTTNLSESTTDHYKGRIVIWISGTLANQASDITGYDGGSKKLIFSTVTEAPQAGDSFVIL